MARELAELLRARNGFFAFESALLVRPHSSAGAPLGILEWNRPDVWRREYPEGHADELFFAEDAFGVQFAVGRDAVVEFDPETGQSKKVADRIDSWCAYILDDFRVRTGYPLAHAWQVANGPLRPGTRLLPKVPFVLGGTFAVDNLYAGSDIEGMRFRATVAKGIADLPDGSTIRITTPR